MKLYLANTTRQVQDFAWRMIGGKGVHRIPIDVGAQVLMPGDWNSEDIAYLEEQHRRYGMVRVDEIDRTKDFIGICFSVNKPISVDKIRYALTANELVLQARGVELRQRAAVAVAQQVVDANPDAGLTTLEMTIQEERTDGGTPQVNEGIRVPTAGQGSAPPVRPTTGGRRRRAA